MPVLKLATLNSNLARLFAKTLAVANQLFFFSASLLEFQQDYKYSQDQLTVHLVKLIEPRSTTIKSNYVLNPVTEKICFEIIVCMLLSREPCSSYKIRKIKEE